jgi:recombination protein RecA
MEIFNMAKKKAKDDIGQGLKSALASIEKEYGIGSIQKMDSNNVVQTPSISTGCLELDLALGIGGFPRGRIVEIYGPESSGKTTVCQHVIANAQAAGGKCAFVDTEHALDPVYLKNTGVDLSGLFISQPDCGEDALNIAQTLIESNELDVVVVDSVAALVPRAEIEGQMGDSHVGLQARLMSQALRKLTGAVAKSNTCLVFTNQIREKIGVMFGNPETTAGGNALKFYASIRIDIRRRKAIKDGEKILGNEVAVKIVKNKLAPPFRTASFDIIYPNGISYERGLLKVAVDMGIVSKNGSWYSYDSKNIGQGFEQSYAALMEDKTLRDSIEAEVKSQHEIVNGGNSDGKDDSVQAAE